MVVKTPLSSTDPVRERGTQLSVAKATLHSQMSVRSFVRPFVCLSVFKTPQQLEIIILHDSSFTLHHSSFILHHSSSFYLHFATFKLFSLFYFLLKIEKNSLQNRNMSQIETPKKSPRQPPKLLRMQANSHTKYSCL